MREIVTLLYENDDQKSKRHISSELHKKKIQYNQNIKDVIIKIKQEFGSLIEESTYKVWYDSFTCVDNIRHNCYHFKIDYKLSNGNNFIINDGMDEDLWFGNYLETDAVYNSAKREIEAHNC